MATIDEINEEIARRERLSAIDAEIARREQQAKTQQQEQGFIGKSIDALKQAPARHGAILESVAAVGSGGILEVPAFITELGAAAAEEFEVDATGARNFAKDTRNAAYKPRLDQSKKALGAIGDTLKPVGDFFNKYVLAPNVAGLPGIEPKEAKRLFMDIEKRGFDAVADKVEMETGSPLLTEMTRKAPDITGGIFGAKALWSKATKSPRIAKMVLADQIKSGNPNINTVTKMLDDNGLVVTNPVSKKALNTLDKVIGKERAIGLTTVMETSNQATKTGVNKMLDIVDEVRTNPLVKQDKRVTDILGESVANRAQALATKNKQASKAIGSVVDDLTSKGVKVDVSDASGKFMSDLENMGVRFTVGDDGWINTDTSRAKFVGGNNQLLNVLVNDLAKGNLDFKTAHELKRQVRDNIDYGAVTGEQLKGQSQKAMKDLAAGINDALKGQSKAYDSANQKFASTIESYEALNKLAGKDIDLFSDLSKETLGSKAVSLLSNNLTRTQVKKALRDADAALATQGVRFKDDVSGLIHMADEIEDLFKLAPSRSIGGNMEKAGASIMQGASPETAIAGGLYDKIKNMRQVEFDDKMKALRSLSRVDKK